MSRPDLPEPIRRRVHRVRGLLRQVRDTRNRPDPLPDVITRFEHRGATVTLRCPRPEDFESWRTTRLRNQAQMERFWDAQDRPWADRHTMSDWLDVVDAARRGRRTRTALLNVIDVDGTVVGQHNLEWIHADSGTAEVGIWLDHRQHGTGIAIVGQRRLNEYAFDRLGLERLTAPISTANPETRILAQRAGFQREGRMRSYARTGAGRVDHELWAMTRADHQQRPAVQPDPTDTRVFDESVRLQARLHDLVPGGAHTYARGEDQYPDGMAPILTRGLGSHVWDADGNEYIEYGAGLRSVTLGHAFGPIVAAVGETLGTGNNFSRPTTLEVAAAEDFLTCVPTAEMVKFAKNGSDVTTAAVRLARATTGRDTIAVCAQPFFSVDDWFISTTPMSAGTIDGHTVTFPYDDLESLRGLLSQHRVAAVVMEAATALAEPSPGYLAGVRDLCTAHGTLLIFDEIITGFRWSSAGAQSVYGVTPDLSCWGKALGNGFPIAALAGRRDLMEAGGLRAPDERVFLLSTTHGPESSSLAAMRAVIDTYRQSDPIGVMEARGTELAAGINAAATEAGVAEHFYVTGRPSCLIFVTTGPDGQPSQAFRTLAMTELIERGILGQSLVLGAAHSKRDVARTVDAFAAALPAYRKALEAGAAEPFLTGRPVAPAIRATAAPRTPYNPGTRLDPRARLDPMKRTRP